MKKIGKIVLHNNAEFLDNPEMKMIRGGYSDGGSGYSGSDCCVYTVVGAPDDYKCDAKNATDADTKAGDDGWWACNVDIARKKCKC